MLREIFGPKKENRHGKWRMLDDEEIFILTIILTFDAIALATNMVVKQSISKINLNDK